MIKMKLLIDICTILDRILYKCTGLHVLFSKPNRMTYVELTFLEGKLGRGLMLMFLKWSVLKTCCILKAKVKEDSI